ncbi:GTP-binding protein [Nocardiopsis sp. TSRI0078]|uniref:tetratricopeptide repeat protein n=1 Tax=unclassified Nocardiopsis TaxID=2649073 RepID=UPI0009388D8E|nr:tetratricopeptide repeat protein [Nocardiopsis sp. TSRI0078]OKI13458.1 GTP-binding protein [Nocardiopsis sp. TSRI0078]
MARRRWVRAGSVGTLVLGAAAAVLWFVGDLEPLRGRAADGVGAAAVLVLAATVLAWVGLGRPAPRSEVPASGGGTANTLAGNVSDSTVFQGRSLTVHQPRHHTVIDTQIVQAPVTEPDWPIVVGVLPNEADHFQERDLTDRIGHVAQAPPGGVLGQVLTGMGGAGKTQLAAHHARALLAGKQVDLVVWVPAAERSSISQTYADAARQVLSVHVDEDPERAAHQFLTWLQNTDRRWLVVLDNLDVPGHAGGLWPPSATPSAADASEPQGRLVVTTRRTDTALTGQGRTFIDVGTYTPQESLAYLATALRDLPRPLDAAELAALADELGHLPLALSHAAAYIRDRRSGMTCDSYRALLQDRRRTLERVFPEGESLPDDGSRTVAATWAVSVEHANALAPAGLARPMMRLVSVLDPTGIPVSALTSEPVLDHLHRARPDGPRPTAQDADDALSALARLHLVTRTGFGHDAVVGAHRLVQRATRDHPATGTDRDTAHTAAEALLSVWPVRVHASSLGQRLRANASALYEHAQECLWDGGAHRVLFVLGQSLGRSGALSQATAWFESLVEAAGLRLGPRHPDSLAARHELVLWRGMAGEATDAARAFRDLVDEMTRALGPDHPQTLVTRVQSARWRGRAGALPDAGEELEAFLPDLLRRLGPDHPEALAARGHLASLRGRAGDTRAAFEAYRSLIADHRRVLGPDHPSTMVIRSQTARWRGRAGDVDGAIGEFEVLLPDQLRLLGPGHPDTLSTRGQIAEWRGAAGDHAGALDGLGRLLPDQVRHLGSDHPHVLTTRHSLARFRGEAGDPVRAAEDIEALLPDQLRVLGPEHPKTHQIRSDLEFWRRKARAGRGGRSGASGGPRRRAPR